MTCWLNVIGIGDDGLNGLAPAARKIVDAAEVLIGGERHLAMLPIDQRTQIAWPKPFNTLRDTLASHAGQKVCVLASGDPCCHGVGTRLFQEFGPEAIRIWPSPSAYSLTCARLGWALQNVDSVSLHGRPIERLLPYVQPGAKVLALTSNRTTVTLVAELLSHNGFGPSRLSVFSHLGGEHEQCTSGRADEWHSVIQHSAIPVADLNTLAIECEASPGTLNLSRSPGLPDEVFEHDGQISKREVRALTLAALIPTPGQRLWDVGAGSGSVSIEWLRHDSRCTAIAIEQNASRADSIYRNARALGVPDLTVLTGQAPDVLSGLPAPHAVFIGGGITTPGLAESCWSALPAGGRLVVNTVSVEGEQVVARCQKGWGGSLTRIAISRSEPLGRYQGWRALAPVTQYQVIRGAANNV